MSSLRFLGSFRCITSAVLVLAFTTSVHADYTIGNITGTATTLGVWGQSFTPSVPGDGSGSSGSGANAYLKSITFGFEGTTYPTTLYIYEDASKPTGASAQILASNGTGALCSSSIQTDGTYHFDNVELSRTEKYFAIFNSEADFYYTDDDVYSGGGLSHEPGGLSGNYMSHSTNDAVFTATFGTVVPEPSILALATLCLVSVTMFGWRRKR